MWNLPLLSQFLFTVIPFVVIMIIFLKIIKIISRTIEGDVIQFISVIPYIFIVYYILNWFKLFSTEEAWGYSKGTFQPFDVLAHMTASSEYLMEEALPTCMALIIIWGILSIVSHHIPRGEEN